MAVRMKDIAEMLGISQTTVSHVLRGREREFRIGAETARRVRAASDRLGYRPSALARGFKDQRAYALCLAVGDLTNPFWAGLAVGAQQEAAEHGYALVVSHTGETVEKERVVIDMLRERRVDGLVLSPVRLHAKHFADLRRDRLPFVLVDRTIDGLDVPSVVTDSRTGMELAVDHLVRLGHRKIAYLGGPPDVSTFRDRAAGFHQALALRQLKAAAIAVAPSEPAAAHRAAQGLLRRRTGVTAVVAANFWLTIGALRASPDDVTVVGFDDFALADLLKRPVTTVAQPIEDLGRQAVRLLVEEIAGPRGARRLVLPPHLVIREEAAHEANSMAGRRRPRAAGLHRLPAQLRRHDG